mmetsp:Transcript_64140/g.171604  ORF Transcript_64140/g.171604 Transcript_64140/m.171604 type:complete len:100 (-) Transcript_64140:12-311(-)
MEEEFDGMEGFEGAEDEKELVTFSITISDAPGAPECSHRLSLAPGEVLKIGRSAKCGICVNRSEVSWNHLEVRPLPGLGALGCRPSLRVRDVSANGAGL